jgi:hypothetical protein
MYEPATIMIMPAIPTVEGNSWSINAAVPIRNRGVKEIMGIASEISVDMSARNVSVVATMLSREVAATAKTNKEPRGGIPWKKDNERRKNEVQRNPAAARM